jgi:OFA family oxalate/formate antiporter-like MFS transporter
MPWNLSRKPPRIFYGWWVVIACFFISLYTGGVVFYGFTAFFEPLADKFHWSYTQISFAASLRGMEVGLLAPIVGILVDRWGSRRLLLGGVFISSLALILLSRTASLAMFYGAFLLLAVGMSVSSSTVLMTAVANWFRRKIGIATGIMISGYGFSGLLVPVIVRLIDTYDWQKALTILAIGMLVLCMPLSLLVRHKPEQYGYQPDGETESSAMRNNNSTPAEAAEVNVGTRQALKSRTFWHIALSLLCQTIILSAVVTHIMPYLTSIRITRANSSLIASALPLVSISGRLGLGWFADRFDNRRLMAVAFTMMSGALLCFAFASPQAAWALVLFLILFGIGYGGNNTLRASALREFFGRKNFGAIHGFVLGIMALGSVAGPPLAGWVFDNWQTYQPIWFAFAGLAVAAILLMITTPLVSSPAQSVHATRPPVPSKRFKAKP